MPVAPIQLIFLVFAFVLACVSAWLGGPGFTWQKALSAALAFLIASLLLGGATVHGLG
jgi:hypothetical protein